MAIQRWGAGRSGKRRPPPSPTLSSSTLMTGNWPPHTWNPRAV